MSSSNIPLFIPCYNCEHQVGFVFDGIDATALSEFSQIVFIDNHSTDGTVATLERLREIWPRISIHRNPRNLGLGGTFKVAIDMSRQWGADYFCFFHGDNQADITDAVRMKRHIDGTRPLHSLLGARFHPGSRHENYSSSRRAGNVFFNSLFSVLLSRRIYDIGSGLNFYYMPDLEEIADEIPDHIAFDIRVLLHMHDARSAPEFYPIRWRSKDERSTTTNMEVSGLIFKEIFHHYRARRKKNATRSL